MGVVRSRVPAFEEGRDEAGDAGLSWRFVQVEGVDDGGEVWKQEVGVRLMLTPTGTTGGYSSTFSCSVAASESQS